MGLDPAIGEATAKELLSDHFIKLPLKYCIPALIVDAIVGSVRNASATLLELSDRKAVITNYHVIKSFEKLLESGHNVYFQVGERPLDPIATRIDADEGSDLYVMDASEVILAREGDHELPDPEFYKPPTGWPPRELAVGDFVIFGGWPEAYRETLPGANRSVFDSYSIAGVPITDAFPDRFNVSFDRAHWQATHGGSPSRVGETRFSGLSGAPVFKNYTLYQELVGFIYEYDERQDKLFVSRGSNLKRDLTLWHNTRR